MKCLLDTHTLLWALFDKAKLSKRAQQLILDDENDIYVSAVSFWEISLKFGLGKLTLDNVVPDQLPHYAKKSGFELLPIEAETASSSYRLPREAHSDPFDRLIVWQAIHEKMTLITKDAELDAYPGTGLITAW